MNDLEYIQERLQATEDALAQLDLALAITPGLPSVLLEIKSLQKMKRRLEEELRAIATNIEDEDTDQDSLFDTRSKATA